MIQRQENLARKQQEIREEMERKKAEAEEEKARTRRRKARLAAEAARRRSPGAYGDDDDGSRDRGAGRDARCAFKTVRRVTRWLLINQGLDEFYYPAFAGGSLS